MQVEFCASWNQVYCVRTQLAFQLNSSFNTLENDQQQYDLPAACVTTQQYSSATFVSLCFHYRKEIFGVTLKNEII
jgi:hypothetical protein